MAMGLGTSANTCPLTSLAELKARYAQEQELELVFFASWCSSCVPYLQAKHQPQTVLVAAFDDPERAAKALVALGVTTRCVTSKDIAESLRVKSLPHHEKLHLQKP